MDGFPALGLHGDKNQVERDWVLAEFKAAKHPIMIATDVAARGLGEQNECWQSSRPRIMIATDVAGRDLGEQHVVHTTPPG